MEIKKRFRFIKNRWLGSRRPQLYGPIRWGRGRFYQRGAIPGEFHERAVILKSELSYGGGSGSGGAEGGGCFTCAVAR